MTTSERDPRDMDALYADALKTLPQALAKALDPQAIARMANAMFAAPNVSTPSFGAAPSVGAPAFVPAGVSTPSFVPAGVSTPSFVRPGVSSTPSFVPPGISTPPFVPAGIDTPPFVPPGISTPPFVPAGIGTPPFVPAGIDTPPFVPPGIGAPPFVPASVGTSSPAVPNVSGSAFAVPDASSSPFAAPPNVGVGAPAYAAPSANSFSPRFEAFELNPQVDLSPTQGRRLFDPAVIRRDFPILNERVHGKPLVWLDNAATTQKPQRVIDRISYFYAHENSNIHRAAHTLAARATDAYEAAREAVKRFLNAGSTREIVFVRGATEAINLVAQSWGRRYIEAGDEIVITWLEHHSNIVPWQQLCAERGARLRVAPVDNQGQIILEEYEKLFNSRTKLAAFTQVSNALGTITPAREMVDIAHRFGARVLVDGAQAVSHMRVDVQALDCDFYVLSGHKVFGPTGIGVLFGKADVLDQMPPWQGGGNMIADVTFEKTVYHAAPARFEAGTGNIADAVGLGAALDYLEQVGLENVARYEHELLVYATEHLLRIPKLKLIGTAREKAGVLSFVIDGLRSEDIGAALDREGIAVRSGHHCAQPALRRFGQESTVRPSLALYNTCADIDALVDALKRIQHGRF